MAKNRNDVSEQEGSTISVLEEYEDDEKPADVVGAKFFGGSAQKEDLFDPVAEAVADEVITKNGEQLYYAKFEDPSIFPDDLSRNLAIRLQTQINEIIAGSDKKPETLYSPNNFKWDSPLANNKSSDPVKELQQAVDFYSSLDVALLAAKSNPSSSDQTVVSIELRWLVSVLWPNAWESRATLTGTSQITLDKNSNQILSQKDSLDNTGKDGKDIFGTLFPQLLPRFWDLYHIGMSPSSEITQRLPPSQGKNVLSPYNLFEIPPQFVFQPTIIDNGGRDKRTAQALPNHCFTATIKTMGKKKDKYVPTSPIEIAIQKTESKGSNLIKWTIPVAARLLKSPNLPLPILEDDELGIASIEYQYQPRRKVATLPYGGNPQDSDVSRVRKKLYEAVMSDGLRPKIGKDGKPSFFFLQNDVKACFTEKGLGMAVYEWQPNFLEGNEVGIELEL